MTAAHPGLAIGASLRVDPYGLLVLRRHYPDTAEGASPTHIEVVQADPWVLISDDLLSSISADYLRGDRAIGVRLEPPPGAPPPVHWVYWHDHEFDANPWPCQPYMLRPDKRYQCWHNWLLHVDAINHHAVYRIDTDDLERNAWEASWPD